MWNSQNIYSNNIIADENPLWECEWIYMDYEKKEVILTIINPENWRLMNIDPKMFVTSMEEKAFIRIMESWWLYYMWLTDEEWNIPEGILNIFKCDNNNSHLEPKYPPYLNCKMIFVRIPWMSEKEDTFDDIKELIEDKQEEIKTKVRVLCNNWITYGSFSSRKPIKKYRMPKNYY